MVVIASLFISFYQLHFNIKSEVPPFLACWSHCVVECVWIFFLQWVSLLLLIFFVRVSMLCQPLFQTAHREVSWTFQLSGGSSCERRRVHSTKINYSTLLKYLGGTVVSASPNRINLGGHLPWACPLTLALGPLLHWEVCPLCLLTSEKQVWRRSLRSAPLPGPVGSCSRVSLHVHSAELLPNLCPVPPRSGSSCPMRGISLSLWWRGAVYQLQKMYFCYCFVRSATCGPSRDSPPRVASVACPQAQPCTDLLCFGGSPNSLWACCLDLCPDLTAPWADGGHTVYNLWPLGALYCTLG